MIFLFKYNVFYMYNGTILKYSDVHMVIMCVYMCVFLCSVLYIYVLFIDFKKQAHLDISAATL